MTPKCFPHDSFCHPFETNLTRVPQEKTNTHISYMSVCHTTCRCGRTDHEGNSTSHCEVGIGAAVLVLLYTDVSTCYCRTVSRHSQSVKDSAKSAEQCSLKLAYHGLRKSACRAQKTNQLTFPNDLVDLPCTIPAPARGVSHKCFRALAWNLRTDWLSDHLATPRSALFSGQETGPVARVRLSVRRGHWLPIRRPLLSPVMNLDAWRLVFVQRLRHTLWCLEFVGTAGPQSGPK